MSVPEEEPESIVVMHSLPEDSTTSVIASESTDIVIEGEYVAVPIDTPTHKPTGSNQLRLVFGMSMEPTKTNRSKKRKKKVRASKQMSLFDAFS